MGQKQDEQKARIFEIASMEHKGAVEYDFENATGYPNPHDKKEPEKKEE